MISFTPDRSTNLADPIVNGQWVYIGVNTGVLALHQQDGLQYGQGISSLVPHSLRLLSNGDLLAVNGEGVPIRLRPTATQFKTVWEGQPHHVDAGLAERPVVIHNDRAFVNVGNELIAYNLSTGQIAWRVTNSAAGVLTAAHDTVYTAFLGARLAALRTSDGGQLWQRQYMYDMSLQRNYSLAVMGDTLYLGTTLATNPDGCAIVAANRHTGEFGWLSRSVSLPWAGGKVKAGPNALYCFDGPWLAKYVPPTGPVAIGLERISVTPRPLQGPANSFGSGTVRASLPESVQLAAAVYREHSGLGQVIRANGSLPVGDHQFNWQPGGSNAFTASNQFGYLLVDIRQANGELYTQSILMHNKPPS